MLFYQRDMDAKIRKGDGSRKGFFSTPALCRSFLQSGVACWMQSFPDSVHDPCCDLQCVGGDGTAIGVIQKNTMHLDSIWEPAENIPPQIQWGRNTRRPLQWEIDEAELFNPQAQFKLIPDSASQRSSSSQSLLAILRRDSDLPSPEELEVLLSQIQIPIAQEFRRWCGLDRKDSEYTPLRHLLITCLSSESVTGAIPRETLQILVTLLEIELDDTNDDVSRRSLFQSTIAANRNVLCRTRVGVNVLSILRIQGSAAQRFDGRINIKPGTLALLLHLGDSIPSIYNISQSL